MEGLDTVIDVLAVVLLPATACLFLAWLVASQRNLRKLVESLPGDLMRVAGQSLRHARRLVVLVTGVTIMTMGGIMLVTPGPGVAMMALGLAVLATEFIWARRVLKRIQKEIKDVAGKVTGTGRDSKQG